MKTDKETMPIVLGMDGNDWDGPWMNRQQILSRLALRGWQVIYSTGALNWYERTSSCWKDASIFGSFSIKDNVIVDQPGKMPFRYEKYNMFDKCSRKYQSYRLLSKISNLKKRRKLLLHIFNPSYFDYVQYLNPDFLVFHIRDAYSKGGNWTQHHQNQYDNLLKKADLVIFSDRQLLDLIPLSLRFKAHELQNGADTVAFENGHHHPEPQDIAVIPHPRIGYVGRMSLKFDWEILYDLALQHQDWHWVLVGEIIHAGNSQNERLALKCLELSNVHWLGVKKHTDLPKYVAHCDVNILLYRTGCGLGEWAQYGSPLKLHEYLATGNPVVGSDIPSIQRFSDVVAIASAEANSWDKALVDAVNNGGVGDRNKRIATARLNSWDLRVDQLESLYFSMIQKHLNS